MIRVFLDANILFSAVYRETSGILRLWRLQEAQLVASSYALTEAERNITLKRPEALIGITFTLRAKEAPSGACSFL